jgi:hypothetical protein
MLAALVMMLTSKEVSQPTLRAPMAQISLNSAVLSKAAAGMPMKTRTIKGKS